MSSKFLRRSKTKFVCLVAFGLSLIPRFIFAVSFINEESGSKTVNLESILNGMYYVFSLLCFCLSRIFVIASN